MKDGEEEDEEDEDQIWRLKFLILHRPNSILTPPFDL
jgi:hypothetical protein